MLQKYFISKRFFTEEELTIFRERHQYDVFEISYTCSHGEIDMSVPEEKEFLMKNGHPRILARFFGY